MWLDLVCYLGMAAIVLLGAGTVLSIAGVVLPAWIVLALSAGWVLIVVGLPLGWIAAWLVNALSCR